MQQFNWKNVSAHEPFPQCSQLCSGYLLRNNRLCFSCHANADHARVPQTSRQGGNNLPNDSKSIASLLHSLRTLLHADYRAQNGRKEPVLGLEAQRRVD